MNFITNKIAEDERKQIEETIDPYAELIAQYDKLILDLDNEIRRICSQHTSEKDDRQSRTDDDDCVVHERALVASRPAAKLPKLELTKFDGDIRKWQEFWDSFQSSVHENRSLSQR